MKHAIQFKRKDTGEVLLISSEIKGSEKKLVVALIDETQKKMYREVDVEVYQQIEK